MIMVEVAPRVAVEQLPLYITLNLKNVNMVNGKIVVRYVDIVDMINLKRTV